MWILVFKNHVQHEIENCFFHVFNELCWDFDGDCILVKMDMFITMLLLPIQEHGRSHHLLLSSFNHTDFSLAWLELLQDIIYYLWLL